MAIERRKNLGINPSPSSESPKARVLVSKGPLLEKALSGLNYLWIQKRSDLYGKFLDLKHKKESIQKICNLFEGDALKYVSTALHALSPNQLESVVKMHQQDPLAFEEKILKAYQEGPRPLLSILSQFAGSHGNTL